MPITSLEAIAQKLQEAKSNDLENILKISGSAAMARNEYGVTVVDENNAASSLLFKSLNKPKIDQKEIIKAIDVTVKELKPQIPTGVQNLLPKELYDEQVAQNKLLNTQIEELTAKADALNSQINTLQSQVQTEVNNKINIEQTNDVLVNQINSLKQTIDDFSKQIQSAIQKSVEESILRGSLQAQNVGLKSQLEGLIKQVDSLNSITEGLQAQLGSVQQAQTIQNSVQSVALQAGAEVVGGTVIVKFKEKRVQSGFPIDGNINYDNGGTRWQNGEEIIIQNQDIIPVEVSLVSLEKIGWLGFAETTFTIPGSQTKNVKMLIKPNGTTGNLDSKQGGGKHPSPTGATCYDTKGGFKVVVKKQDGTTAEKLWDTRLWKGPF